MQKLIQVAPGLKELVYLGKATSQFRKIGEKMDYDELIVDAYSTGHFLALLRSPQGMLRAVRGGPMNVQCQSIIDVLRDPEKTEYFLVAQPDHLTTIETIEFEKQLNTEFSIRPKIILNKVKANLGKGKASTDFSKHYSEIIQNQGECLKSMEKHFSDFEKIPFVYENQAGKVIKSLSEHVSTYV